MPPFINFAPLDNAVEALTRKADKYSKALGKARGKEISTLDPAAIRRVNALLIESERKLALPDGLPGRPWYKHQIYAPGFYTGYAVKTLPGAREAIEQKKWQEAEHEIARVASVLQAEAQLIDAAAEELKKTLR